MSDIARVAHRLHVCNYSHVNDFHTKFIGTVMMDHHTQFPTAGSYDLLVFVIRRKAKHRFDMAPMLLLNLLLLLLLPPQSL